MSYGRIHPVANNALLYGFAIQAGLGVLIWLTCQLAKAELALSPLVLIGWLLWNSGVQFGLLGIAHGETTGHEWLEIPRYGSIPMLIGCLCIGLSIATTFHQRKETQMSVPQWFILAALFWFPWVYSTAIAAVSFIPVRGVVQSVIDGWYAHNLRNVWFVFVGLATLFYLAPLLSKRPLHSRSSGLFVFWTLLFFGSWGGLSTGSPVPSWIPALCTAGALLTIAPILAAHANLSRTLKSGVGESQTKVTPLFVKYATISFRVASLAGILFTLAPFNAIANFTWFIPAQQTFLVYGFFGMTMFAAIYHIFPQLLGTEFASNTLVKLQFRLSALGVTIYFLTLAVGGVLQGLKLNDGKVNFLDVVTGSATWLRISTLGELLMIAGNALLLLNLLKLLISVLRVAALKALAGNVKPVGVKA